MLRNLTDTPKKNNIEPSDREEYAIEGIRAGAEVLLRGIRAGSSLAQDGIKTTSSTFKMIVPGGLQVPVPSQVDSFLEASHTVATGLKSGVNICVEVVNVTGRAIGKTGIGVVGDAVKNLKTDARVSKFSTTLPPAFGATRVTQEVSISFGKITSALEIAGEQVAGTAAQETVEVVRHAAGESAASATKKAIEVGTELASAVLKVKTINSGQALRKTMTKAAANQAQESFSQRVSIQTGPLDEKVESSSESSIASPVESVRGDKESTRSLNLSSHAFSHYALPSMTKSYNYLTQGRPYPTASRAGNY